MSNCWKHFKTICRHKWIVFKLMCKCGYPLQGLMHDMSKFSPVEFFSSASYFQGDKSPIEAEKIALGYSAAWAHHKGHNPHHWEYWMDYTENGIPTPYKMPYKYVVEMACDYVAAGMVYSKEKWDKREPLRYFDYHRPGRFYHPSTDKLIRGFLIRISNYGLDNFCMIAKSCKHTKNPENVVNLWS